MRIGIASDHGAFELKEELKQHFKDLDIKDYGCHSTDSVDYPPIIQGLCRGVLDSEIDWGIALCGTGIGASITANRFSGIRAALCHNTFTAEMAKRHNNANILVMGGRVLTTNVARRIVQVFIENEFEGGRHQRRLDAIEKAID